MELDPQVVQAITTIAGGTAFVGWYRERRKGKRDAYSRATDYMDRQDQKLAAQDSRIDELNRLVGELQGQFTQVTQMNQTLAAEKAALILENTELKAENKALKNRRVRTTDSQ